MSASNLKKIPDLDHAHVGCSGNNKGPGNSKLDRLVWDSEGQTI